MNPDKEVHLLAAPARRALEKQGIKTLEDLAKYTRKEISGLHGIGPGALEKIETILKTRGLHFKNPRSQEIDQYILTFPEEVREKLNQMRETIRQTAPEAEEKIAYMMPTYFLKGNLVHFGGMKNHIGFYPTPRGIEAFQKDLAPYQTSRGAIRFPLDRPLPLDLVKRIVEFRVKQMIEKIE